MPCWFVGKSITAAHRSYGRFRHRCQLQRALPSLRLTTLPRPRSNSVGSIETGVTELQIGGLQRKLRAASLILIPDKKQSGDRQGAASCDGQARRASPPFFLPQFFI